MLWKLRRHARRWLHPMLGVAALLWLATALAPCFVSAPQCDGMEGTVPCAHATAPSDCDTTCLQGDSRYAVAANLNLEGSACAPLLLALVALVLVLPLTPRPVMVTRPRAPDTPLHLQLARLLI